MQKYLPQENSHSVGNHTQKLTVTKQDGFRNGAIQTYDLNVLPQNVDLKHADSHGNGKVIVSAAIYLSWIITKYVILFTTFNKLILTFRLNKSSLTYYHSIQFVIHDYILTWLLKIRLQFNCQGFNYI